MDYFSASLAEGVVMAAPPFCIKNPMQEVLLCQVVFWRKPGIPAALPTPFFLITIELQPERGCNASTS
jgi:hypothetical protein